MTPTRLCANCGQSPQTTDDKCECGQRHKYDWIGENGTMVYLDRFSEMIKARLIENETEKEITNE